MTDQVGAELADSRARSECCNVLLGAYHEPWCPKMRGAGAGDHPYVVVEAVPSADHPDGAIIGLAHGGGIEPETVPWILQRALDQLRPEPAADRAELEQVIGVILASAGPPAAEGLFEPYLDGFQAQDLAADIVDDAVGPVLDKLRQALVDEQGSHAMTQQHFTDYAEEWTVTSAARRRDNARLAADYVEVRRQVGRLTELLDAAQLDRDKAQADAAAALARLEQYVAAFNEPYQPDSLRRLR